MPSIPRPRKWNCPSHETAGSNPSSRITWLYTNPVTGRKETVPRHSEIKKTPQPLHLPEFRSSGTEGSVSIDNPAVLLTRKNRLIPRVILP
jgi:hypothetical protein